MNPILMRIFLLMLKPEDGGGGGGAGGDGGGDGGGNPFGTPAAAAGGAGDKPAAGGDPPKGGAADGAPYHPQGLPDHLRGTNDRETIDKVLGAFSGLRTEMSKRGTVVKDAKDYKLALSETASKVIGNDLSKDRSVAVFRSVALKHGLTAEQASGLFSDIMDENIAAGIVKTIDPMKEAKAILGDAAVGRNDQDLMAEASRRWQALNDRVDGMVAGRQISEDQAAAAKQLMETANGVLFLETMFKRAGEHGLQPGGQSGAGGITKADLDRRINDPRANPMHPKYDPAFEAETDRLGRAFYSAQDAT